MKNKITSFFVRLLSCFLITAILLLGGQINLTLAVDGHDDLVRIAIIPSDSYYGEQWYLQKIKAQDAWDIKRESPQVIIAVIDAGIDINHPDLQDNIWVNNDEIPENGIDDDSNGYIDDVSGWDFVDNTPDPNPKFSEGFTDAGINHGTIIAGIIAAQGNNSFGVSGVTWQAQIMPLKGLDDKGEGNIHDVIRAIDYAINNRADIINMSFVGMSYSQSLEEAIRRAYKAGLIIVAAAGNEAEQGQGHSLDAEKIYPICHDGSSNMVIGVAAVDTIDQKTDFSNYGFSCVDISAPGTSFFGLSVYEPTKSYQGKFFNKYEQGFWSGTSMATPLVSGSIALLKGINPKLSREKLVDILLSSADNISRLNPGYLGQLGRGRLNLLAAAQRVNEELVSKNFKIIVSPQGKLKSEIKVFNDENKELFNLLAYGENFLGGARATAGDVDADGEDEIITGAGNGGGPHVRIFNQSGEVEGQFFAYIQHFRGGVNVAAGDIDGDGIDEIITGAGPTGGPHVRIFDQRGNVKDQFFAYNKFFRGGVNIAVGDIDGDGIDEIITGPGPGGGPHVRVFDRKGNVKAQFFAYGAGFEGGVSVAVGDIDGDGKFEIITGAGPSGGPHVRIFDQAGNAKSQFFAYNKNFRGGVNVTAGDINQDGTDEIITGAGPGGGPHVRVFDGKARLLRGFFAYDGDFRGGVMVGVVNKK